MFGLFSLQFTRMAHFLSMTWAAILAVYWLISGAFLSDLYNRYCDELGNECGDVERKFIVLPSMAFFCMVTWVSIILVIAILYAPINAYQASWSIVMYLFVL